ncbi:MULTISPECIES: Crp/Fnr family transcriptional regulator [Bosea]|uniref:Crp/Fnr family transcriptional regulator n=1 Tax=Bosea TaxID=85413 RepID=UPI00214FA1BB|nr:MULTISPECIES: cyclic nucleotide-binding domain-containing protein [Bosea]MCR4524231.1 cyclic nucleotide-binding domain-containing protein [Bosea sp. 47.2.35]MDR6831173.1 CRP-like cAMP-binding protein [Bosea robiniae]MDR6897913.1 CRP-like cAMP-binding protein [Bosea sp. BE109]MDR7141328.1 CRP-like cAMP-binding protein [Bosea sp. BE168]MDR7177990.1 CRP-like cAMP-binding protein [Bosea sp. BE271]
MSLETDIGCLRCMPLFQDMPASRLKLVALMGERLQFEPGAILISPQEKLAGVYVIMEGEVEISQPREGGEERRFVKDTGSITGDVALLSGKPFIATVSAKSHVLALRIPKDLFFELLQTVPEFSLAVCRDLAERVHRLASVLLREHETV